MTMWPKSSITLFIILVALIACQNTATNTPQSDVTESTAVVSLLCAERHGKLTRVEPGSQHLDETLEVNIYLPPCYDTHPAQRYPVLYLLHGAGLDIDTWPRLGAAEVADQLIASGEIEPLIIMPPSLNFFEDGCDPVFLDDVVPYVDAHYRTLPDRQHRALDGMSVGGLPTLRVGL
jgi:enterochelin esterase-like enzyme